MYFVCFRGLYASDNGLGFRHVFYDIIYTNDKVNMMIDNVPFFVANEKILLLR